MSHILVTATFSVRGDPETTQSWISLWQSARIKPDHCWNPECLAPCICQQEPEPLLHVFLLSLHTVQQEQVPQKKSKFPTDLWPGAQRYCPACIQRRFKQSLWLHYRSCSHHLSTHQWTLEATTPELTDQVSLIHSPPRCLCQVMAGGKRKTDQYISHRPDR